MLSCVVVKTLQTNKKGSRHIILALPGQCVVALKKKLFYKSHVFQSFSFSKSLDLLDLLTLITIEWIVLVNR